MPGGTEGEVTAEAGNGEAPARIMVVDDHPIVRQGLTQLIKDEPDLDIVGAAASHAEALEMMEAHEPDLAILDLSLGKESGLDLLKIMRTRRPSMRVLVLSMHDEAYYADRVLRAGAIGYIMKQEPAENVITAIRQALEGKVYLSEAIASSMLTRLVGRKETGVSPIDLLSDRELQVLQLIGKGRGTRQIAEQLHLSIKTVENYREHIKSKLNLRTGPELVRYAVRWEIEQG